MRRYWEKLLLNTADRQQLENVGGIGRERAERIVQSRPIRSWEDLGKIEGFSDKLVQDLKNAGARIDSSHGEQEAA